VGTSTPPPEIDLGSFQNKKLKFIFPVTLSSGDTYYFLDANGDGQGGGNSVNYLDAISHDWLDLLLNEGANTDDTIFDYFHKADDARSRQIGDYIIILTNDASLYDLQEYGSWPENKLHNLGWSGSNYYWSANKSELNSYQHHALQVNGGGLISVSDSNSFLFAAFQVLKHDVNSPIVTTFSPTKGATGVAIGSDIVVTFSEAIQRGTGNIVLKDAANNVVATYDAASDFNLSVSGSTLTINPPTDLGYSTNYFVTFASGSIRDLTGNNFIDTNIYNFNTNFYPEASAVSITTVEDIPKAGTLLGTDVEGSNLTFAKVSDPTNGTVTINGSTGAYTYTPKANYNGSDSFTFKVNDGTVDSTVATVSITVAAVNDMPLATAASVTTDEDTAKSGTLAGTDVEGSTLTFAKVADPANGTVTINASTGAYTYTPKTNYNGSDSFTFKVNDGCHFSA
jgi:VCBS repeat-containing protein